MNRSLVVVLVLLVGIGSALAEEKKDGVITQTAAEAKAREGRTGTSNENAEKQLKQMEADEKRESSPPTTTQPPKKDPQ